MIPSTAIPAAQPRKRRTRTTNVSSKLALLLSELPLNSVELTPRAEHMACPACQTWCPLTTHKGSKQWKLVPHHTAKAGTPGARRCGNSNRLVTIDMPIAVWQEQRAEAVADVAARRPTTVLKKVRAPQPVALHQLDPAPATAASARTAYELHRARCAGCTATATCPTGLRLEGDVRVQQYREPQRVAAQARAEQEQRRAERRRAEQQPKRRRAEWAGVRLRVLAADILRELPLEGAVGPIRGVEVPTDHEDTREVSRARAEARTEQAIRAVSPIKRDAA